jgi:hypothetical protein
MIEQIVALVAMLCLSFTTRPPVLVPVFTMYQTAIMNNNHLLIDLKIMGKY